MRRSVSAPLLFCTVMAMAQESSPSWDLTNDFLYQHNELALGQDGRLRPRQFQEVISLLVNDQNWSAGISLRGVNFYKAKSDITVLPSDTSVYRAHVQYSSEGRYIRLGDFNAMLGRGLVLSVIQNDGVLLDWTIRGGDLRLDWGRFETRALAGTVSNNLRRFDAGKGNGLNFQQWDIAGLELGMEWLKGNRVGVRASAIRDKKAPESLHRNTDHRRVTDSISLSGSNLWNLVDYYAEAGQIDFRDADRESHMAKRGSGAYGNLAFHWGGWLLMGESKRYRNFDNELNNAPLADRETEKLSLIHSDGTRGLVQYSFRNPDLVVFLSVGRYREGTRHAGSNVYGGFRLEDWRDRLSATYTYGLKTVHEGGRYPEKKTDASLGYRFTPLWSAEFTYRDKRNRIPGSQSYGEWDLTAQVSRSPWGSIFITKQYSSSVATSSNPFQTHSLYNGGLRINLRKDSYIEISGGRMRGGETCAGGQCVILPAFQGWKLATHLRL